MIRWTRKQLDAAGVDKRRLAILHRKLTEASAMMLEMGFEVYGADGSGYLIHRSRPEHDKNGKADLEAVVADVGMGFNGGGW
jgi:hypothetical protein